MASILSSDLEILSRSTVLKELTSEEIKKFSSSCEVLNVQSGNIFLNEEDIGKGLYIILEGEVDIFLPKSNRKGIERLTEVHITKLKQSECFGEYSLIDSGRLSASIKALTNLKLLFIDRKTFKTFSDMNHRVAKVIYKNMLEVLVERLRGSIKELDMAIVIR